MASWIRRMPDVPTKSRRKSLPSLKDPHTGAFALIGLGVYLLWSVAVWSVADRAVLPGMACAFVLSRTLSGLSVTLCKGAKKDGLAAAFSQIRQGTASMRFHRMLFCRVCGCLMFDIGCADICVAYPDFGGRFWLVSVDG